jgi:hypothetical protein
MIAKLRRSKRVKKLLLHWAAEQDFTVPVMVLPRVKPRTLKNYTICIHQEHPGSRSATT